ncbi:MAG: hypothetical protein IJD47_06345 [Clostridia bacterium]|nr:hypothetical protein [Clostridia bacterium]
MAIDRSGNLCYNVVEHLWKLSVNANACLQCGHCDGRCPFGVQQQSRMQSIASYFNKR